MSDDSYGRGEESGKKERGEFWVTYQNGVRKVNLGFVQVEEVGMPMGRRGT